MGGLASDWIAGGLKPMQHTGSVKAAECRRLLWHAGDYVFYDLFGEFQPSLDEWLDIRILRQVEGATADYDNANAYVR